MTQPIEVTREQVQTAVDVLAPILGQLAGEDAAQLLQEGGATASAVLQLVAQLQAGATATPANVLPAAAALWELVDAAIQLGRVKLVTVTADSATVTHTADIR